ncbi:MAG: hypothetical protein AB7I79_07990 [Rhizobiaceae bacterium]
MRLLLLAAVGIAAYYVSREWTETGPARPSPARRQRPARPATSRAASTTRKDAR